MYKRQVPAWADATTSDDGAADNKAASPADVQSPLPDSPRKRQRSAPAGGTGAPALEPDESWYAAFVDPPDGDDGAAMPAAEFDRQLAIYERLRTAVSAATRDLKAGDDAVAPRVQRCLQALRHLHARLARVKQSLSSP